MPLSEHEQRLLDEMERNLYRHDADFVASVSGARLRPSYRSIVLGSIAALAGVALIVVGLATHLVVLGILGFVVLLAGVVLAMRTGTGSVATGTASSASTKPAKRSFMSKMSDRWDRRTS